jgi:HTH-type transcriptional regulator, sugar sensing transcriptional regulator
MDYKIAEELQRFGLHPNETKVYLAILEMGQGTVSDISKTAQLNRTTGYDVLERLSLYGLTSRTTLGGKRRMYIAEPPSRLKQYLENKKHQADRRLADVGELIPDLQNLYKKENKPVIKFFEGAEGIKNIYWHTLESKKIIYSILDLGVYGANKNTYYDQFGKDYVKERAKLGVKEKALVVKNEAGLYFYETTYKNNPLAQKVTEYRWLKKEFPFIPAAEVNIYDDVVMGVLAKPGENAAFEIKNASFANSLKIIFEIAWENSKKM